MTLVQYNSEQFEGLQVVIDHQTGKVYATQSALARLIDKHSQYVYRHEKALVERGNKVDRLEAEVLTPGGSQGSTLYGEDFIYSLLAKYKPDLLVQAAKAGIRVYFYGVAGYSHEVVGKAAQKALPAWKQARQFTQSIHPHFQNACLKKKHPAGLVHDLITLRMSGLTRKQAIATCELMEEGLDPSIGLNYQPNPDELERIAEAKECYCRLKKGTWMEQANRACDIVLAEYQ